MEKELTTILKDLIRFKTYEGYQTKKEEVDALYTYVKKYLGNDYLYKYIISNNQPSLIAYKKNCKKSEVVLQAHIDVVPGNDNQFEPVVKKNKLFGRGASDMKFALAAYLVVLKELEKENHSIALWLTSDEEIGGFDGIRYLLNTEKLICKFCVLPDGTNNWNVTTEAKGVLHFSLKSEGKSAHGSKPWLGENAIKTLITIYPKLEKELFIKPNKTHWHNTINLGKIEGGVATNSVADTATVYCDYRFTSDYSLITTRKILKDFSKKYNLIFEEKVAGNAYSLDMKNPFVKNYLQIMKENSIPYKFAKDHGSSDARFFAEKNIPAFLLKPICGGDHSDQEWIDLSSLQMFTFLLKQFIMSSCLQHTKNF
jgi:succinyl-diaminopimelate desuccinylase